MLRGGLNNAFKFCEFCDGFFLTLSGNLALLLIREVLPFLGLRLWLTFFCKLLDEGLNLLSGMLLRSVTLVTVQDFGSNECGMVFVSQVVGITRGQALEIDNVGTLVATSNTLKLD